MSVRAVADNDTVGSASAQVTIYKNAEALPDRPEKPADLRYVRKGDIVEVDWRLADQATTPAEWRVSVGGGLIATVDHTAGRLWLQVKDMPKNVSTTIEVTAVTAEGVESEPAQVVVDSEKKPESPVAPQPPKQPPVGRQCPYEYKIGKLTIFCRYKEIQLFSSSFTIRLWYVRW